MACSRNCIIGSLIAIVIVIGGGVGIYYATKGDESTSNESKPTDPTSPAPASRDQLLIKSNDGTIRLFDRNVEKYVEVKAFDDFGITSFAPHLDETIYYATTEPKSVIHSTDNVKYPDLPSFTADWIKTAIAVDDVTEKVYVADRVANKIRVVDRQFEYALPLDVNAPRDVVLAPEKGTMFVLEKSQIVVADMDGTNKKILVTEDNIQALAVDSYNGFLYFAHAKGVESLDYTSDAKKRIVLSDTETNVQSLAYTNMTLYFVNKKGKSSKKSGTSLDVCHLDNSKCVNSCCNIYKVIPDEKLNQVKIPINGITEIKNPCETKNGDCEQLCLLNTKTEGRSCACGVGWKLKVDGKSCEKST